MKAIKFITIFTLFFASFNFTSCSTGDEKIDPALINGSAPASLTAEYDGKKFETSTIVVDSKDDYISITGTKSTGEFFQVIIPEAVVGTYTWKDFPSTTVGFGLGYSSGKTNDIYFGAKDDSGIYESYANYTDTAEIKVTNVDPVNKKISGTFHFTGVRFADNSTTTVITKEFTKGTFTNVSYGTPDIPVTPDPTTPGNPTPTGFAMTAVIDGVPFQANTPFGDHMFSSTNLYDYYPETDFVMLQARQGGILGNPEINMWLKRSQIAVGTYQFGKETYTTTPSHFIDLIDTDRPNSEITIGGSITITEVNTTTKIVKGTFQFTSDNSSGDPSSPTITINITNGTFNYQYE